MSEKDLKAVLAELAAAQAEGHLSADELAAYAAGELEEGAHDRAQEHLAACPECAGLLLDLRSFSEPHPPASEFEVAAVWRGIRNRVEAPVRPVRWLPALAAGLLIATMALSFRVVSLQRRLDEADRPQINAPVQDLRAPVSRGTAPLPTEIVLKPEDRAFTLVLVPASRRDFPDYEVSLSRADGKEIWKSRGFRKNRFGSLTLALPRDLAGPGAYRVRLTGINSSRRELLGEYNLSITTP
jgi:hypothetical protein